VSTPPCCGAGAGRRSVAGRGLEAVGWAVPSVVLALLPKCPLCLAAYVTLGTGVGLSVTAAGYLRLFLIVACVGAITFLAARRAQRVVGAVFSKLDRRPGASR
jgi:hypothetical protein